jgi:hypothetical protein
MTNLVAQMAQQLMDACYVSGPLKGTPILCSDPDFNDLPYTHEGMLEADDYSEEDMIALSKQGLRFMIEKLEDPLLDVPTLLKELRDAVEE